MKYSYLRWGIEVKFSAVKFTGRCPVDTYKLLDES